MKKFPGAPTLVPGQAEFILNLWEWLRSKKDNIVPIESWFLQYEITQPQFLPSPFQKKKQTPEVLIWSYWRFSDSHKKKPSVGLMLWFPWHCSLPSPRLLSHFSFLCSSRHEQVWRRGKAEESFSKNAGLAQWLSSISAESEVDSIR